MRNVLSVCLKALLIAVAASAIGLAKNHLSHQPLPIVYTPPGHVVLSGVVVPFINEREARRYLGDPGTIFVDARLEKDYSASHVKGAVFLEPGSKEDRFPLVQPLLPEDARLILYCYGPECPMAEEVAAFLAQLGYKHMMIMTAGFKAWQKQGYPVEKEPQHAEAAPKKQD
uniref:Rhodanese-like domain-containing protein n=1 Tax=Desulfomonile tiedjei TaxID=2358 RepID=A0A7C4AQK5_9BACT